MYIAKTDSWYLERVIWLIAGIMTSASALLSWLHSPYWLILTGLVGINLLIFAFTGFCVMANILHRLGVKSRIV
ncbi:MAG: DUF2892 domain-containing protein [Thermodesulfovibrionales bacterium]|nr:DUF2892 domain-containing protein [Thermodesulfovibrionales bacterium]